MDSCNIQLFKDGDDIIVVFKNANAELSQLITTLITGVQVNTITGLEPPPTVEVQKPNIENLNEILPDFMEDNPGEMLQEKVKEEKKPPEMKKSSLAKLTKEDLSKFLFEMYPFKKDIINEKVLKEGFTDLTAFATLAKRTTVLALANQFAI